MLAKNENALELIVQTLIPSGRISLRTFSSSLWRIVNGILVLILWPKVTPPYLCKRISCFISYYMWKFRLPRLMRMVTLLEASLITVKFSLKERLNENQDIYTVTDLIMALSSFRTTNFFRKTFKNIENYFTFFCEIVSLFSTDNHCNL